MHKLISQQPFEILLFYLFIPLMENFRRGFVTFLVCTLLPLSCQTLFKVFFEKLLFFLNSFWYCGLASEDLKSQMYHLPGMYLNTNHLFFLA